MKGDVRMGTRRQGQARRLGSACIGTALWLGTAGVTGIAPGVALAQQTYTFDVPAQPVMQAVNQIGRVGGFSVVFSGSTSGLLSSPIEGTLSREEALALATDPLGPLPEGLGAARAGAWTAVANVLLNLDAVLVKD